MGRAGDLRRHPQAQQQDRLHQHAEHRFATAAQRGKRAAGVQTGNGKEETGDGEQVDQGDEIPSTGSGESTVTTGSAVAMVSITPTMTYGVRRNTQPEASGPTLWRPSSFRISRYPAVPRSTAVMQPRAGDANDPGQQRRDGKQHQRL